MTLLQDGYCGCLWRCEPQDFHPLSAPVPDPSQHGSAACGVTDRGRCNRLPRISQKTVPFPATSPNATAPNHAPASSLLTADHDSHAARLIQPCPPNKAVGESTTDDGGKDRPRSLFWTIRGRGPLHANGFTSQAPACARWRRYRPRAGRRTPRWIGRSRRRELCASPCPDLHRPESRPVGRARRTPEA